MPGPPNVDIALIGPPVIKVGSKELEVDTRKAIALLAYLAVEKEVTRDTAAGLFWADSSEVRAKASLRRTLSALRAGAGNVVAADRARISMSSQARCDVDLFNAEVASTATHGHDSHDVCEACIPHLRKATDVYRGDFLAGFFVRDSPGFEDWARSIGESLRIRAGEAFHRLGMAYSAQGDYANAIESVRRWTELDLLHEPAHRLLMLLHAWAGDRPGAIEAYRRFVAILDSELGVSPLEETTELYGAILDEDLPPPPGLPRRPQARQSKAMPSSGEMLDRVEEMDILRTVAATRRGDNGVIAVVDGAAWMGKTRLLEEFAAANRIDGDVLIFARAFRMERHIPFGVVSQILESVFESVTTLDDEMPDWVLEELARLLPSMNLAIPARSPTPYGELRLMEAITYLMASIAMSNRVTLVVEDVQWIDDASGSTILFMANRLAKIPIFLLVSHRTGERVSESARELLAKGTTRITLRPLTKESFPNQPDGRQDLQELINRTGGVPLLMATALKTPDESQDAGMLRLMETRLESVNELAEQVLSTAAVLGGSCTFELLRETSGRSDDELVDSVEELIAGGLLREIEDRDVLVFPIEAMEEMVYESTSLIRRRHLHRRAARALSADPRSGSDASLAAAVADQFSAAGEESEASTWFRIAGDLSRDLFAFVEARHLYENSLALGERGAAEVHLALGEISIAEARYELALQNLTTGSALANGETLALVEQKLGQVNRLLGRFSSAEAHFLAAEKGHPNRADLYADWALLHRRNARVKDAREISARASELARSSGDSRALARALSIQAVLEPDADKSLDYLDSALEIANDDQVLRMSVLNNRAYQMVEMGDDDQAIDIIREAIEIASVTGYRHREAALLDQLADIQHRMGDQPQAEETQRRALALFADVNEGSWEPELWSLSYW